MERHKLAGTCGNTHVPLIVLNVRMLIARAKKGSKCTPEEHTILLHALKHKKAQAHASKPAPFVIQPGIVKELTSMMKTWLMNEAACPPVVREEPDNTLNLLDVDLWLWYQKVTPKGMAHAFKIKFWELLKKLLDTTTY